MSPRSPEQAFFYSRSAVATYDATADLAAPHYRSMQEELVRLVQGHLAAAGGEEADILDIGSGTGVAAAALLAAIPGARLVALDFSAAANRLLRRKLRPLYGAEGPLARWQVAAVDVLAVAESGADLRRFCRPASRARGFAAVVSSLTLHHFTTAQKRAIYGAARRWLAPGGLLVNADLFDLGPLDGVSQADPGAAAHPLSGPAQDVMREWIRAGFDDPPPGHPAAGLAATTRRRLKRDWLRHIELDHHLDRLEAQAAVLRELGFQDVACPFRFWQSGILWAVRG